MSGSLRIFAAEQDKKCLILIKTDSYVENAGGLEIGSTTYGYTHALTHTHTHTHVYTYTHTHIHTHTHITHPSYSTQI